MIGSHGDIYNAMEPSASIIGQGFIHKDIGPLRNRAKLGPV